MKNKNQDDLLDQIEKEIGSSKKLEEPILKRTKIENNISTPEPTRPEIKREDKLRWLTIDMDELPGGNYYPIGTIVKIRPPRVVDIQNYSMMDPFNYRDVLEKIDGLLDYCVRITIGPNSYDYTFLKETDRVYLLIYLRELGLPSAGYHTIKEECPHCTKSNDIELNRGNIVLKEIPKSLKNSFNPSHGAFIIEEQSKQFVIGLPTIGMRSYMHETWKEEKKKRTPNRSFFELYPYIFPNDVKLSDEVPLIELEREWEEMDPEDYMIMFDLIQEIDLGISHLAKKCSSCGEEVRTDARFPEGFRSLFSVLNRSRSSIA